MKWFSVQTLILIVLIFLIFPTNALAIVKFSTDYQNYYRVDSTGNTHVSFLISQKNNLSAVYATEFGLNINETKVTNVKVTDEGTIIIPEIVKTLNQTTISFPFAHKVVGRDKIHSFIIEYDTTDVASKFGNTWQVNIPRLETDDNISSRSVILTVPENFPTPAYIEPKPDSIKKNVYYFNGNNLGNKTISAVFGQTQYYQGTIFYHLKNESRSKVKSEIALPPDTSYQTVFYENLDPKPNLVKIDKDGNYLAEYLLEPSSNLEIKLKLSIKLNFNPKTTEQIPDDYLTQNNEIWNYDNNIFSTPEIKNLATPKTIFDYVSDKLTYDFEKVNRQKSQKTPSAESLINHQSAICTDFANLFVSLARKAGIPSRELEGFAISENPDLKPVSLTQDVLHAWPEYYDKKTSTWIQVDPTWTNTTRGVDYFNKLDFNHIVFVIHGASPDYPIPAGGYKYKQEKTKDISIEPTQEVHFPEPKFTFSYQKQTHDTLIFTLNNLTGVSYSGNSITQKNKYLSETEQFLTVPPFGQTEIKIKLTQKPSLSQTNTKVIIYVNGNQYEDTVTIQPTISPFAVFPIAGFILGALAFTARRLHLRRQKQKTVVYREINQSKK